MLFPWIYQALQTLSLANKIPFHALMDASQKMFLLFEEELDEQENRLHCSKMGLVSDNILLHTSFY